MSELNDMRAKYIAKARGSRDAADAGSAVEKATQELRPTASGVALGRAMFQDPKLRKARERAEHQGSYDDLGGEE